MGPYYMARLGAKTSASLLDYSENAHLTRELRQFREFLWVDHAHCAMLAECGIIPRDDAIRISEGLRAIGESDFAHSVKTAEHGSLLLSIEAELGRHVGSDRAALLHTGRSRLDQGPTARRMYKRRRLLDILTALASAADTIGRTASDYAETVMPGYTCLQHASPTTFGHFLGAVRDRLLDQAERLIDAYARVNLCPLGSAGLSGTTWPIDRELTAELLGFRAPLPNARCGRDAYYATEIAAVLSTVMSVLYDLATDLQIWSSAEFGIVEIGAAYCSTSSMFPNKRNPTAVDAIRSYAGEAVNWFPALLAKYRGTGTSDVVMQEAPLLDDAFITVERSLALTAEIVASLTVKRDRIERHLGQSWAAASNLADQLYRVHGIPYRRGYTLVASLVKHAEDVNRTRAEITASDFNAIAEAQGSSVRLTEKELSEALDPNMFVKGIRSSGGAEPRLLRQLLEDGDLRSNEMAAFVARETARHESAHARCLAWAEQAKWSCSSYSKE